MKLAIVDKPIMMDHWRGSLEAVLIGSNENGEKLLLLASGFKSKSKSDEEYTSTVAKIYKVGSEYIIMTENSIYLSNISLAITTMHIY